MSDGGNPVKRYPIVLGRDPIRRKLHQDFSTTPEGLYRIINLKTRSMFHKAFDLNYPNRVDRIRYDFMKRMGRVPKEQSIGGEIQIHGQFRGWGLERNWTWGCISLRDMDVDELFNHKEIAVGTPVVMVGGHVTRKDVLSIKKKWSRADMIRIQARLKSLGLYRGKLDGTMGAETRWALGRYQLNQGYPVTCELDARSVRNLIKSGL